MEHKVLRDLGTGTQDLHIQSVGGPGPTGWEAARLRGNNGWPRGLAGGNTMPVYPASRTAYLSSICRFWKPSNSKEPRTSLSCSGERLDAFGRGTVSSGIMTVRCGCQREYFQGKRDKYHEFIQNEENWPELGGCTMAPGEREPDVWGSLGRIPIKTPPFRLPNLHRFYLP